MYYKKIISALNLTNAVCVKPTENKILTEEELLLELTSFPEIEENTLIIVNDQYRATPCSKIIKLLRQLNKINTPVAFIIATGSHEPPDIEEAMKLTNAEKNDKIIFHDVHTQKNYSFAGITKRGTEVLYNPALDNYKNIITIGSVEPHYFAGFTGGAKSLLPGITAKKTITENHRWALDPNATQMKTKNNPVFEDIWEGGNLIRSLENIKTIQLVNHGEHIYHISTGNIIEAFNKAKPKAIEAFGKIFNYKFDNIITFAAEPLNLNLYQSQKAIDNVKNVLKEGGNLVLISECSRGIGGKSFFEKLSNFNSPEEVIKNISFEKYNLGDHKAYSLADAAIKFNMLYIGDLEQHTISKAFMKKISIEQLLESYKNWNKNNQKTLIDIAGGFTNYYYEENRS